MERERNRNARLVAGAELDAETIDTLRSAAERDANTIATQKAKALRKAEEAAAQAKRDAERFQALQNTVKVAAQGLQKQAEAQDVVFVEFDGDFTRAQWPYP